MRHNPSFQLASHPSSSIEWVIDLINEICVALAPSYATLSAWGRSNSSEANVRCVTTPAKCIKVSNNLPLPKKSCVTHTHTYRYRAIMRHLPPCAAIKHRSLFGRAGKYQLLTSIGAKTVRVIPNEIDHFLLKILFSPALNLARSSNGRGEYRPLSVSRSDEVQPSRQGRRTLA